MKLEIELVPSTSWYTNVRSNVSSKEWDKLRKECYLRANNKCEICNDNGLNQGFKHRVECHEIWEYNDDTKNQKLVGLISLCVLCHRVKHIGLSQLKGYYNQCLEHLCKVNSITLNDALKHVKNSYYIFETRSNYKWNIDITYLDNYFKEIKELF